MRLSAIIIAKDAEKTIQRTLKSVAFADEQIVIIDHATTDQTVTRAQNEGARVITNPWPGYGPQKNFGIKHAQGQWVLFIDDDEEVPPALQKEIQTIIANPQYDFYWLRIVTVFLGTPLNHMYGHNPRLLKKAAGKWTDAKVHEQVQANDGQLVRLADQLSEIIPTPLLHYSHDTIGSYIKKMHRYTTLDAEQMQKTNQHRAGKSIRRTWWLPYYLSVKQFIKLLFYRRGILDGYAGFAWCALSSYYEYEMAKKYLKLPLK